MVDFRRCITVLAVLALFAGLASAAVGGVTTGTGMTCQVTASPVNARAEGMTELVGDIVLTCIGGNQLTAGSQIPTVNFTVAFQTQVTSRLVGSNSASEALLLVDEPNSGLSGTNAGYGPTAPQQVCPTPLTGCTEYALPINEMTASAPPAGGFVVPYPANGPNVFQGVVSGNQVVFYGIPILAPASNAVSRVYRFTNLRVNATGVGAGSSPVSLIANLTVSNTAVLQLNQATANVATVSNGLATTLKSLSNGSFSAVGFPQCTKQSIVGIGILRYQTNFPTAFKTRFAGVSNGSPVPVSGAAAQNVPGVIYYSESNFIPAAGGVGLLSTAGVADFGTRVKAVFNNIPAGVSLYVTVQNTNSANASGSSWAVGNAAGTGTPSAVLVATEGQSDANGLFPVAGTDKGSTLVQIPVVNGSAMAVWEVTNAFNNQNQTLDFGVAINYAASPSTNSPAPGTGTVNMSYAPTPTAAFAASDGVKASATLPIPRFADTSSAKSLYSINVCRTVLLFPYVINVSGFDTGIAISNTSSDPFGTGAQAGTCALYFYGASAPAMLTSPVVATGTEWPALASTVAPGFNGYVIAICNFQYAHGFAFVSDVGARNLAMGYLADIIPDPATNSNGRVADPLSTAASGSGESLGH